MEYEIHITVGSTDREAFKADCQDIGVKPIVIETQRENVFNDQVMTSSKYREGDYMEKLEEITEGLRNKGYHIVRKKVEIYPGREKHESHLYYETHFRLKLPKGFDRE